MIRLIVRADDAAMAAHVGGSVLTSFVTLDVELPELEALLASGGHGETGFRHVQLVGCEVLATSETKGLEQQ